ncbi:MAG TPA: NirA family protein [Opitutaceae bacterium]|nr:NirA family protein [Opitutaceae bacterium]
MTASPPISAPFTAAQKEYLQGFFAGALLSAPFVGHTAAGLLTSVPGAAATGNLAAASIEAADEENVFGTPLSELSKPERWKREQDGLDVWDKLVAHAATDKAPDDADNFRFRYFGLFHVAPAQDSFMVRLRIPAGELTSHQLRGLAELAADLGNGFADITTRANLQLREFRPKHILEVLSRIQDLGLSSKGSGADNIRNLTATPTSGFDRDELVDVRPFAKALSHYILNHRDLFGLPRKFNIAFDSGGAISAAADTNDIGFFAVRVTEKSLAATGTPSLPHSLVPGIYFRVELGGISGHGDFARDTGLLLASDELVPVAAAMVRVFREHGDRTDRKKARLKYLLEKWGLEKFIEETGKRLAFPLRRLPREACEPRSPVLKHGHLGVYRQRQPGLCYVGVGVPVGRLSVAQLRRLAALADQYGKGEVRLTVWQNLLIPHVSEAYVSAVERAVRAMGLFTESSTSAGCVIACTGRKGCKYAAADTKGHAVALARHLAKHGPHTEFPVNIHLTGCPNSCAQHYCGDIGAVSTKLADGREGYHLVVGGGMGAEQGLARALFQGVAAEELNTVIPRILAVYQAKHAPGETFVQWARRHSVKELQEFFS